MGKGVLFNILRVALTIGCISNSSEENYEMRKKQSNIISNKSEYADYSLTYSEKASRNNLLDDKSESTISPKKICEENKNTNNFHTNEFEEPQSPLSSSGQESGNDEDETDTQNYSRLSQDSGISLKNTKVEVCNHLCPACCNPSNYFCYNKETKDFVVYLDEEILKTFDDSLSLKDLDMSNDLNIFMANLCVSFLIDIMNKGNVFFKKFVGECRNLEKTLNLSLYNKTENINLFSYIEKKFEFLKNTIPSHYSLNDGKFLYAIVQDSIQVEEGIYDNLEILNKQMFKKHINQSMKINIVTQKNLKDDLRTLQYEEKKVLSKFIKFTRNCYLDLLNYVFRSLLEEIERLNNEYLQRELTTT